MEFSEPDAEVIAVLRRSKEAWVRKDLLPIDVVLSLIDRGIMLEWNTPEGLMVTLTAIGAKVLGFDLRETYKFGRIRPRPDAPKIQAATEIPRWVEEAALDPKVSNRKKLKAPKFTPGVLPIFDEPPKPNKKEQAKDPVTGDNMAIRFGMLKGIPVMVDPRMKKGKK